MGMISEGLWEDSFIFSKSWYSYLHWVVKNPAVVFPYYLNIYFIEQWDIIMQNIINFNAKLAINKNFTQSNVRSIISTLCWSS